MAATARPLRLNLRAKLILILLAIGVLPLLITGAVNISLTANSLRQSAINDEQVRLRNEATTIERFLDAPGNDILLLSQSTYVQELAEAIAERNSLALQGLRRSVEAEFENFARERKFGDAQLYEHIRFLDNDGFELVRIDNVGDETVRATGADLNFRSSRDYYVQALELQTNEVYVSAVELFDEFGRIQEPYTPVIHYSTPVYVEDEIIGVVVTDVRVQGFLDTIEANTSPNAVTLLVDQDGYYLAHPDESRRFGHDLGTEVNLQTDQPELASMLAEDNPGVIELSSQIAFYTPVLPAEQSGSRWYLISLRPLEVLLAAANQQQPTLIFGLVVVAAIVTGAALYFAQNLGGPIVELTRTATEIAGGKLDQRVQIERSDELGTLGQSFNTMAAQINELVSGLEQRVAARTRDLETAAEVSRQVGALLDPEALLALLVDLTRQRFNLYYAQVYRLDTTGKMLVMTAGAGEAGIAHKENLTRIALNAEPSIVAAAARTHEPRIVKDSTQEPGFLYDPILPKTRSEMAVPMVAGQQLIGVLDLQSEEVNRFGAEDLRVMNTLVGQVTIALENARLYAEQVEITDQLRAVDRLKSQFLANMSHELRTPLNAILNFTEFIANGVLGEVNEQQLDALQKVINSGDHLLSLINDILDITKIESGMMELFIEEVNLNKEVDQVLATAGGLMRAKPVTLVTEIAPDLPTITGDRRRIRQILLNLISNAIKFTLQGSVTVRARVEDNVVMFEVQDTGVGISPEDQSIVFESFRQGRQGLKQASSTGLGLPISKYLVEAHGGKLWLESQVGTGTTFFVMLPMNLHQPQPALTTT